MRRGLPAVRSKAARSAALRQLTTVSRGTDVGTGQRLLIYQQPRNRGKKPNMQERTHRCTSGILRGELQRTLDILARQRKTV